METTLGLNDSFWGIQMMHTSHTSTQASSLLLVTVSICKTPIKHHKADGTDHGRVKDSYPGLYDFLNGKNGTTCPKSISLGPQGSYFISTGKKSSFKCHPNAAIYQEASLATQLWWGFDGAYVMAQKGKPLKADLRGHYPALDDLLKTKPNSKIQVSQLYKSAKGSLIYPRFLPLTHKDFYSRSLPWISKGLMRML